VLENGRLSGLVTPHEIKQVDAVKWPYKTLHDVMRPLEDIQTVTPDVPLIDAVEMMSRHDLNQLPVVSDGHLQGVLSRGQVLTYLHTRMELQHRSITG
jgi:CBS domain-containing protein